MGRHGRGVATASRFKKVTVYAAVLTTPRVVLCQSPRQADTHRAFPTSDYAQAGVMPSDAFDRLRGWRGSRAERGGR